MSRLEVARLDESNSGQEANARHQYPGCPIRRVNTRIAACHLKDTEEDEQHIEQFGRQGLDLDQVWRAIGSDGPRSPISF